MATAASARDTPAWIGGRTRRAASVYLGLAGVVNVLTAVWLYRFARSEQAIVWLIEVFVGTLGDLGGLYRGDLVSLLVTWILPGAALGLLLLAALQFYASWLAYGGRGFRRAVGLAVVGSLNIFALPPGLVAAALFALSREQFPGTDASTPD